MGTNILSASCFEEALDYCRVLDNNTRYEENKKTKSHKFADKMGLDLTCFQVLRNCRGKEMVVRVIEARPLFLEN